MMTSTKEKIVKTRLVNIKWRLESWWDVMASVTGMHTVIMTSLRKYTNVYAVTVTMATGLTALSLRNAFGVTDRLFVR